MFWYLNNELIPTKEPSILNIEPINLSGEWAKQNPKEAKELAAGVKEHALLEDGDAQFWIDWLVKDGKIKEGQFKPSDIYTNEYNPYYKK